MHVRYFYQSRCHLGTDFLDSKVPWTRLGPDWGDDISWLLTLAFSQWLAVQWSAAFFEHLSLVSFQLSEHDPSHFSTRVSCLLVQSDFAQSSWTLKRSIRFWCFFQNPQNFTIYVSWSSCTRFLQHCNQVNVFSDDY